MLFQLISKYLRKFYLSLHLSKAYGCRLSPLFTAHLFRTPWQPFINVFIHSPLTGGLQSWRKRMSTQGDRIGQQMQRNICCLWLHTWNFHLTRCLHNNNGESYLVYDQVVIYLRFLYAVPLRSQSLKRSLLLCFWQLKAQTATRSVTGGYSYPVTTNQTLCQVCCAVSSRFCGTKITLKHK